MPSTSAKQARFMAAAAHDPAFAKRVGISQSVARDFNQADKGSTLLSRAMKQRADGGHVNPVTGYRGNFQPMLKGGFVATDVPGRTDKHYVTVKEGSYVLPADHVSALGENNSIAGAKVVKDMFGPGTRYGSRLKIPAFARGGGIEPRDGVPVVVAGGEIILPPEIVRRIGNGDLGKGHAALDKWVLATREKHIKKLKSLKPPKGADKK